MIKLYLFLSESGRRTLTDYMSRAFVQEGDGQWLHDVAPTVNALLMYLTRENNGIIVVEEKRWIDASGREVHAMSNGLSYAKDDNDTWYVIDED